jgi:predicted dehydrogenase
VTRDLRAGIIGLGAMGRHHARVLRHLPGVRLVGAADPRGDVHRCLDGLPVLPTVTDLLTLGVDYCVLATPTSEHVPVGLLLAAAGVPTLVEKPLASDHPSALTLADAFASAGVLAAAGYIERYNPALQALRDRLEDDQLGGLYQITTRRQEPFPARVRDVGVVADLATHDLHTVSWVTSRPTASICALTTARDGRLREDLLVAIGQLTDGVLTHHLVNWLSPLKERLTIACGHHGVLVADTLNRQLTFHPSGSGLSDARGPDATPTGSPVTCPVAPTDPLRAEHEAFRDALRHDGTRIVTLHEAATVAAVTDAILASAATGAPVAPAPPRPAVPGHSRAIGS